MRSGGGAARSDRQLDRLRREFGDFDVVDEETVVSREMYADCLRAAEADALGGARALVTHLGRDAGDVAFLRYERDPEVWDVPGGATRGGESFEETARRHVCGDVGADCEITGVSRVLRETFVLVAEGEGVSGLWVFFDAETDDALSGSEDVLETAWFERGNVPNAIDPQVSAQLGGTSAD